MGNEFRMVWKLSARFKFFLAIDKCMKKYLLLALVPLILFGCTEDGFLGGEVHGDALKEQMTEYYCKSPNTEEQRTVLGYLEERDDVDNKWFPFIVCEYKNLNTGEVRLRIFQKDGGGSGLSLEEAQQKAAAAFERGEDYYKIGIPYTQRGELDTRRIEYRIYQENGEPVAVEVFVVMRTEDRAAKPAKTLRIDWPRQ